MSELTNTQELVLKAKSLLEKLETVAQEAEVDVKDFIQHVENTVAALVYRHTVVTADKTNVVVVTGKVETPVVQETPVEEVNTEAVNQ